MKKLIGLVVSVSMMFLLTGCQNNITSIEIEETSVPSDIRVDEFDISDFSLIVTYRNDETETIPLSEDMLSSEDLERLALVGSHEVTVNYEELSTIFTVELVDDPLNAQLKMIYQVGLETNLILDMTYEEWVDSIRGEDGVGIEYTRINEFGELVIVYTDGEEENLGDIVGEDGREIELDTFGNTVQWKYVDDDTWTDLLVVDDGKSPVFQVEDGSIQWRYEGEDEWNELVALTSLMGSDGEDGQDGREIELRVESTFLQWKYTDEEYWMNLLPLYLLEGEQGERGVNGVGIVDALINEYGELVLTYSNGQTDNVGFVSGGYEVVFVDGENVLSRQRVAYGYSAVEPMIDLGDGYLGYSWSQSFEEITSDVTVELVKDGVEYSLVYQNRLGQDVSLTVECGEELEYPIYEEFGYMFDGWYLNDEKTEKSMLLKMPSNDLTLYAKWIPNEFSVDFETNEGTLVSSMMIPAGWTLRNVPSSSKDGYEFGGWYFDESFSEKAQVMPTEPVVLYAKWEPTEYTISYQVNGGVLAEESPVVYPIDYSVALKFPTKVGYDFVGWYNNSLFEGEPITWIEGGVRGDMTLYARWERPSEDARIYAYEFLKPDGGSEEIEDYQAMIADGFDFVRFLYASDQSLDYENGVFMLSDRKDSIFKITTFEETNQTEYITVDLDKSQLIEYRFSFTETGELKEEFEATGLMGICPGEKCALMSMSYKRIGEEYMLLVTTGFGDTKRDIGPSNMIEIYEYILSPNGDKISTLLAGGSSDVKREISSEDSASFEISKVVEQADGSITQYSYYTSESEAELLRYYQVINQGYEPEYMLGIDTIDREITDLEIKTNFFKEFLYANVLNDTSSTYVSSIVTEDGSILFNQDYRPYTWYYSNPVNPGNDLTFKLDHFRGMEDLLDQLSGVRTNMDLESMYLDTDQLYASFDEVYLDGVSIKEFTSEELQEIFMDRYIASYEDVVKNMEMGIIPSYELSYPSLDSIEITFLEYDMSLFEQVTYSVLLLDPSSGEYLPVEGLQDLVYEEGTVLLESMLPYQPKEGSDDGVYKIELSFDCIGIENTVISERELVDRPTIISSYEVAFADLGEATLDLTLADGFVSPIDSVTVYRYGSLYSSASTVINKETITFSNLTNGYYFSAEITFENGYTGLVEFQLPYIRNAGDLSYLSIEEEYFVQGIVALINGNHGFLLQGPWGEGVYVEHVPTELTTGDFVTLKGTLTLDTMFDDNRRYLRDVTSIEIDGSGPVDVHTSSTAVSIVDMFETGVSIPGKLYQADLTFSHVDQYGYAYFDSSTSGDMQIVFKYIDVAPFLIEAKEGAVLTGVTFALYDLYYGNLRVIVEYIK